MVADRVTVVSRMAGDPKEGVRWESDGQGEFTIEQVEKAKRGTDVILHLKEEDRGYLDPWKAREVVKQYSDFIEHPIVMDVERDQDGNMVTEEETLNARKAIWLRPKSQITEEEYRAFVGDLVNFLVYVGEPIKMKRYNIGIWVIVYLLVLLAFVYLLKREYWKDVH